VQLTAVAGAGAAVGGRGPRLLCARLDLGMPEGDHAYALYQRAIAGSSRTEPLTQAQRAVVQRILRGAEAADWAEVVQLGAEANTILCALREQKEAADQGALAAQLCSALAQANERVQQFANARHWLERRLELAKEVGDKAAEVAALEQLNRVQESLGRQAAAIASHARTDARPPHTPALSPSPAATPVRSTPMTSADASPEIARESPRGAKRTWGDATTLSLVRPAGIGLQANSSGEKWGCCPAKGR
jgi:peptidyl-tRNA hydrolase